jgi:hypothetical protein
VRPPGDPAFAVASAASVTVMGTSSWQSRAFAPFQLCIAASASLAVTRSFAPAISGDSGVNGNIRNLISVLVYSPGTTTMLLWPEESTQIGATPVVPPSMIWQDAAWSHH